MMMTLGIVEIKVKQLHSHNILSLNNAALPCSLPTCYGIVFSDFFLFSVDKVLTVLDTKFPYLLIALHNKSGLTKTYITRTLLTP
jgi:hypothetical protein